MANLGPDRAVVTNELGGKGSEVEGRFDLIPGEALQRLGATIGYGATRYGTNNWRLVSYESHINHALEHLAALLADDKQDDHLGHALTRLAMAVATESKDHQFTLKPSPKGHANLG